VSSEFIVKFAGFYVETARRKYIGSALKKFDASQFEVVHRNNPMAAYPSDFDVVVRGSVLLHNFTSFVNLQLYNLVNLQFYKLCQFTI
jgi:hypothetical protein